MKNPAVEAARLLNKLMTLDPLAGRSMIQNMIFIQVPVNEAVQKDGEFFTAEGCISMTNVLDAILVACARYGVNLNHHTHRFSIHGSGFEAQPANVVKILGHTTALVNKSDNELDAEMLQDFDKAAEELAAKYRGRNVFDLLPGEKKVVLELVRLGYIKANSWAVEEVTKELARPESEPTHPGEKYVDPTSDIGACYIYYKWCSGKVDGPAPVVARDKFLRAAKQLSKRERSDMSTWMWWLAQELISSGYIHKDSTSVTTRTGRAVHS